MARKTINQQIEELLNQQSDRNTKIRDRISSINSKREEIYNKIVKLKDQYVNQDIEGKAEDMVKTRKVIFNLEEEIKQLDHEKEIYRQAINADGGMKIKAMEIYEDAIKELEDNDKKVSRFRLELRKIEEEKAAFEKKIDEKITKAKNDCDGAERHPQFIANQLLTIEKYIYGEGVLNQKEQSERGFNKNRYILDDLYHHIPGHYSEEAKPNENIASKIVKWGVRQVVKAGVTPNTIEDKVGGMDVCNTTYERYPLEDMEGSEINE